MELRNLIYRPTSGKLCAETCISCRHTLQPYWQRPILQERPMCDSLKLNP